MMRDSAPHRRWIIMSQSVAAGDESIPEFLCLHVHSRAGNACARLTMKSGSVNATRAQQRLRA